MSERFTAQELAMLANPAYIGSHQPWVGELDLVNVVRCRDCKFMFDWAYDRPLCKLWADGGLDDDADEVRYPTVTPDGFCAWGGEEMSERREFVEVERLGNMARYSVTVPIEVDPIYARTDALERRIEQMERKLNHKGERTMDERTGGSE